MLHKKEEFSGDLLLKFPLEILALILCFSNDYYTVTQARVVNKKFKSATEIGSMDTFFWKDKTENFYPGTYEINILEKKQLTYRDNFIIEHQKFSKLPKDESNILSFLLKLTKYKAWRRFAKQGDLETLIDRIETEKIPLSSKVIIFILECAIESNHSHILNYIFGLACKQYQYQNEKDNLAFDTKKIKNSFSIIHWAVCCNKLNKIDLWCHRMNINLPVKSNIMSNHMLEGYTPLHLAAHFNLLDMARLLIEKGANLNVYNTENVTFFLDSYVLEYNLLKNFTPLHLAVYFNFIEMAELLIKNGANVNCQFKQDDFTPLHITCMLQYHKLTRLLVKEKANVNQFYRSQSSCPVTALWFACHHSSDSEIVTFLSRNKAKEYKIQEGFRGFFMNSPRPILISMVEDNNAEMVKELLNCYPYSDDLIKKALSLRISSKVKYLLLKARLAIFISTLQKNIQDDLVPLNKKIVSELGISKMLMNALKNQDQLLFDSTIKKSLLSDGNLKIICLEFSKIKVEEIWQKQKESEKKPNIRNTRSLQ